VTIIERSRTNVVDVTEAMFSADVGADPPLVVGPYPATTRGTPPLSRAGFVFRGIGTSAALEMGSANRSSARSFL
jgi:hypothetical protein